MIIALPCVRGIEDIIGSLTIILLEFSTVDISIDFVKSLGELFVINCVLILVCCEWLSVFYV
jgi:hypothetical protein